MWARTIALRHTQDEARFFAFQWDEAMHQVASQVPAVSCFDDLLNA
jgi:hypothetical protein